MMTLGLWNVMNKCYIAHVIRNRRSGIGPTQTQTASATLEWWSLELPWLGYHILPNTFAHQQSWRTYADRNEASRADQKGEECFAGPLGGSCARPWAGSPCNRSL